MGLVQSVRYADARAGLATRVTKTHGLTVQRVHRVGADGDARAVLRARPAAC